MHQEEGTSDGHYDGQSDGPEEEEDVEYVRGSARDILQECEDTEVQTDISLPTHNLNLNKISQWVAQQLLFMMLLTHDHMGTLYNKYPELIHLHFYTELFHRDLSLSEQDTAIHLLGIASWLK